MWIEKVNQTEDIFPQEEKSDTIVNYLKWKLKLLLNIQESDLNTEIYNILRKISKDFISDDSDYDLISNCLKVWHISKNNFILSINYFLQSNKDLFMSFFQENFEEFNEINYTLMNLFPEEFIKKQIKIKLLDTNWSYYDSIAKVINSEDSISSEIIKNRAIRKLYEEFLFWINDKTSNIIIWDTQLYKTLLKLK